MQAANRLNTTKAFLIPRHSRGDLTERYKKTPDGKFVGSFCYFNSPYARRFFAVSIRIVAADAVISISGNHSARLSPVLGASFFGASVLTVVVTVVGAVVDSVGVATGCVVVNSS